MMLASTALALLLPLSPAPQGTNDTPAVIPVPAWVEPLTVDTDALPTGSVPGGISCLLMDTQADATGDPPTLFAHQAWYVHDAQGLDRAAQIDIGFDPSYQEVFLHSVRVHRDGEIQDRLDASRWRIIQREEELDLQLYDGTLTALRFLEDVRVGDTVEFSYSLRGRNPAFAGHFYHSFSLQTDDYVQHLRCRIRWPGSEMLQYRGHGTDLVPTITRGGDAVDYVWERRNVEPADYEFDVPGWCFPYPWVQTSSHQRWKEVVDWAVALYTLPPELDASLQTKVEEIRATGTDDEERALAALRFVRDEIRYLGIELGQGSYVPSDPGKVYNRRFGDCKDKALLLASMLGALDIEAVPALVHTAWRHTIDDLLPSPHAFNHVIVQLSLAGRTYWVDPTDSSARGGIVGHAVPDYGRALVVREGESGLSRVTPNPKSAYRRDIDIAIDARDIGGPARMTVSTEYSGGAADLMRFLLSVQDTGDLAEQYEDFYRETYSSIASDAPLRIDDDEDANRLRIVERYTLPELWVWDEENDRHTAGFYAIDMEQALESPERTNRSFPFGLSYPSHVVYSLRADIGDLSGIMPELRTVENEALRFEYGASVEGDTLVLRYELENRKDHVPLEEIVSYVEDVGSARETLYYEIEYGDWNWGIDLVLLGIGLVIGFVLLALLGGGVALARRAIGPDPFDEWSGRSRVLSLPMFTIWTHPRHTVRRAIDMKALPVAFLIAAAAGIFSLWDSASGNSMGDDTSFGTVLLIGMVAGPIAGCFGLAVGGLILTGIGSLFGGKGSIPDVMVGLGFANLIAIWFGLTWIPALLLGGEEMFTTATPTIDASPVLSTLLFTDAVLSLGGVIWGFVVTVHGLAEAHRFSAWRALWTILIPTAGLVMICLGCLAVALLPALA